MSSSLSHAIAEFVEKAPSIPDGRYELVEGVAFGKIMSYSLSDADSCKVECHDIYVDLQSTVEGCEGISVFDRAGLVPYTRYDRGEDVTFLLPSSEPVAHLNNVPGRFTLLFPDDAHRPQEKCPGHPDEVRKLVVKIRLEALGI